LTFHDLGKFRYIDSKYVQTQISENGKWGHRYVVQLFICTLAYDFMHKEVFHWNGFIKLMTVSPVCPCQQPDTVKVLHLT